MNLTRGYLRLFAACLVVTLFLASRPTAHAIVLTNYFTQFEASEGYTTNFESVPLIGQKGWVGQGSGGNGFTVAFGVGVFIGNTPPGAGTNFLRVWHPVTSSYLLTSNAPIVTFSTTFIVFDSSSENGHYDSFRWSVYNAQSNRLFTINFNNDDFGIYYMLDGVSPTFIDSGFDFNLSGPQLIPLTITMNATSNRWSAFIGGTMIITNQPITTVAASTTMGHVAAEWVLTTPGFPGDNFMVFDDYKITDDVTVPASPQLKVNGAGVGSSALLRLTGQDLYSFAIDATTNLAAFPILWTPIKTNTVSSGFFDVTDTGAAALPSRFYRARWVP